MPSAVDPSQEIGRNLVAGLDHLSGWADLLDAINVYPVADGDTGRNLLLSLYHFGGLSRKTHRWRTSC